MKGATRMYKSALSYYIKKVLFRVSDLFAFVNRHIVAGVGHIVAPIFRHTSPLRIYYAYITRIPENEIKSNQIGDMRHYIPSGQNGRTYNFFIYKLKLI